MAHNFFFIFLSLDSFNSYCAEIRVVGMIYIYMDSGELMDSVILFPNRTTSFAYNTLAELDICLNLCCLWRRLVTYTHSNGGHFNIVNNAVPICTI